MVNDSSFTLFVNTPQHHTLQLRRTQPTTIQSIFNHISPTTRIPETRISNLYNGHKMKPYTTTEPSWHVKTFKTYKIYSFY